MEGHCPTAALSRDQGTQEGKVRSQSGETRPHVSSEVPTVSPSGLSAMVLSLSDPEASRPLVGMRGLEAKLEAVIYHLSNKGPVPALLGTTGR